MLVELHTGQPLFPGASDVDQLWKILQCLCSPSFGFAPSVARHPTFMVSLVVLMPCSGQGHQPSMHHGTMQKYWLTRPAVSGDHLAAWCCWLRGVAQEAVRLFAGG